MLIFLLCLLAAGSVIGGAVWCIKRPEKLQPTETGRIVAALLDEQPHQWRKGAHWLTHRQGLSVWIGNADLNWAVKVSVNESLGDLLIENSEPGRATDDQKYIYAALKRWKENPQKTRSSLAGYYENALVADHAERLQRLGSAIDSDIQSMERMH